MTQRIVILGAGFGGMELSTLLSEGVAGDAEITLIDHGDSFVFGYSKLDVMFRGAAPDAVRLPYTEFVKPGVDFVRDTVVAIDPERRRVTTANGSYDADILVVALGADYDYDATPGLTEEHEFYSYAGAFGMRDKLAAFSSGAAVIGVCGAPFKCPPAPSECALMLHDSLVRRGVRDQCTITLVLPFMTPVPPSPDTSAALVGAFAERDIAFVPSTKVKAVDHDARQARVRERRRPAVRPLPRRAEAPRTAGRAGERPGGRRIDPGRLRHPRDPVPGVYAIGDVATQGTPKAGVFAEGAARALAATLIGQIRGTGDAGTHTGTGSCYIEFGGDRIGRVDVDFLSGPSPTGVFQEPSETMRVLKEQFGSSRRARWFGRTA